ncbi:ABC transporter permease [Streptomyces bohaiensis]|uniref:ABC transporter permease n=1 Tax=Streptomyces bohaiensis TaxID=1431344 RepID=A0ABX1C480_9ACTN|nr:ABC transporter permease [Streptomyces bohaiensis]NJQ14040.1 ABC transporter permease [Streptomyces bohaiensis]
MSLALVHTRYQLTQLVRIPVAILGAAFFPAASLVFFVVPNTRDNPAGATLATASMVVFAVMISNLFGHGTGVAEDRSRPWDPYTRTLPIGPAVQFLSRIFTGIVMMMVSLVPVVIIAALFTPATLSFGAFVLAIGTVLLVSLPFTMMGLAIGYSMSTKAALAIVQLIFLPLAFGGGLMSTPGDEPGFIQTIAPYVPTRGAVELMWAVVGDHQVNPTSVVSLAVWTVLFGSLAVLAYRRDEGRRFH